MFYKQMLDTERIYKERSSKILNREIEEIEDEIIETGENVQIQEPEESTIEINMIDKNNTIDGRDKRDEDKDLQYNNLSKHIEYIHNNISKIPNLLQKLKERYQYKINVEKSIVSMTYRQNIDDISKYEDSLAKNDIIIESIFTDLTNIIN